MKRLLFFVLLGVSICAPARETVSVCFNYSCLNTAEVTYRRSQLLLVSELLSDAIDAAHEREQLSLAIGVLLGWAGRQSPIWADRGSNFDDDGVYGKMDCIDHSITTTRLLKMLERKGWLRWHRVLEPEMRNILLFAHWTAVIEEVPQAAFRDDDPDSRITFRFAVDSWFRDNGKPAVIQPLGLWMDWKDIDDNE